MALSFTTISGNGRHSLPSTNSGFNSEIDEEEVDQLDSGLDDETDGMEPEIEEEESISTAKGRRKLGVRQPGHTLVPQDRLDNILQAEGMCVLCFSIVVQVLQPQRFKAQDLICPRKPSTCSL